MVVWLNTGPCSTSEKGCSTMSTHTQFLPGASAVKRMFWEKTKGLPSTPSSDLLLLFLKAQFVKYFNFTIQSHKIVSNEVKDN